LAVVDGPAAADGYQFPFGFTRGQCLTGPERGRVLVWSAWRAEVELRPWEARFEITGRRVVAPAAPASSRTAGTSTPDTR
jgi:hypothetical protein